MLSILTEKGYLPLDNRENFNIVYDYEGEQTLSFDISPNDINYPYIIEKAKLIYGDNRYNVRKINKRKTMSTVTAELDLNEWKTRIHLNFHTEYDLFVDVIKLIIPEGWVFDDAGAAKGRRAITLEGVTDYDVLMACKNTYGIAFEYHITDRRIKVIDPLVVQERGLYLTDELNLDSVEYKGDFTKHANRLYAYGKKEEIENEDGTKTTTYVNFADINQGKKYVDCMEYVSDEIVCAYWQDDRYTVPENLLTDATEKIRALAYPVQAWNCNIHDLSRTNEMYKMLDFKLYDKPTLLTDGQTIVHQIVQYTDYPDNQNLNKVVLSTAFKKIQGEISEIRTDINDLDLDRKVKEYLINEIRRDVNSNTLLIQDTYRKGDIDTQLSSIIQQTEESITIAVGSVEKKLQSIEQSERFKVTITATKLFFRKKGEYSQLIATVTDWGEDITNRISDNCFTWIRTSKNPENDTYWNNEYGKNKKQITVSTDDVLEQCQFDCIVDDTKILKNLKEEHN